MRIRHLLLVSLMAGGLAGTPVFAAFQAVASPSGQEFGFEQPATGTDIFTLGGPPWSNVGNRLVGVVQAGDGAGGNTAGSSPKSAGLQSAKITPLSSNAKMILSMNPLTLPQHTARASFAFQAPTGNNDFEWDMFLEGSNPDTFRAVWISADNGVLRTRDSANGNAITVVANYEADNWYEVVWEKPAWSDGTVGQPFTVSLYDSTDGSLVGSASETLGQEVANFQSWTVGLANVSGNFLNIDHFSYVFDDAGDALPTFDPRAPEPGTLGLIGFAALALLGRRRHA